MDPAPRSAVPTKRPMENPVPSSQNPDHSGEAPASAETGHENGTGSTAVTDSEFGPLQPADGGYQLALQLDCSPDGEQSLSVFLDGAESIDPVQRGILRNIVQQWSEIWPLARKAWCRENPKDQPNAPTRRQWVLEAEIASQKIIETEFEGDPIWRLSVSSSTRASMLVLMLEGSEILDEEWM